jgi:p-aminobenzoyl-glutamate transporter AbgT
MTLNRIDGPAERSRATNSLLLARSTFNRKRRLVWLARCVLVLSLFALLALTSFGKPVVDVHVQLVFFGYIFFGVLDVVQSRVVSVLASLTADNSLAPGIGMIKAFVVLAFVLCKFFVFFPTWQLMGHYADLEGGGQAAAQSWEKARESVRSPRGNLPRRL